MSELYRKAGVDVEAEDEALKLVVEECRKTFNLRRNLGSPVIPIAHFAGIIKFNEKLGLALKTDGVGTKVLVAQLLEKYDTVGIDCVAMNVNDIICVGAEPVSFVDYIAVQQPNAKLLSEIAKGLAEGAKQAKITIIGGEIAQLPEIIKGKREGFGFDLAGMCLGIVELDKIVDGGNLREGDVIIGLESSGIHSNGLTLARKILIDKAKLDLFKPLEGLNKTLGEELLTPTKIYVQEVLEMLKKGINVKAMAHITGKGLLNLRRVGRGFGYQIDYLPEPQPIFKIIQKYGKIPDQEMYEVFNMGVGFCLVTPKEESEEALQIAEKHKVKGYVLGRVVKDPERKVVLKPRSLISAGNRFITL